MVQVKIEKLKYLWANNKQTIIIIASALVLTIALLAVRAASPFASFEAEGANLAGNASVKSASGTSGGNYVEFGGGDNGGGGTVPGRIAISSDGNWHDLDDILATPVSMAILGHSGNAHKLVYYGHSDHLWDTSAAREEQMRIGTEDTAKMWEGFDVDNIYNAYRQTSTAVHALATEINKSTAQDPLWIIGAGPMEVICRAVRASNQSARQYAKVISHSDWNNEHAKLDHNGCHFDDIPGYGMDTIRIIDQNPGIARPYAEYHWLRDSSSPKLRWLWDRGQAAGKVNFDASDAGMIYWLVTGGVNGGDEHGTPKKLQSFFASTSPIQPPQGGNVVSASDDFYTENGSVVQNSTLRVENDSSRTRQTYMKFNLSSYSDITSATLSLRVAEDGGSGTVNVYTGSHNNWSESSTGNLPSKQTKIGSVGGTHNVGDTLSFDITNAAKSGGVLTLIADIDSGSNDVWFGSSESSSGPTIAINGQTSGGGGGDDQPGGGAWVEQNGQISIQFESVPVTGSWQRETSASGYSGSAYYTWRGPDHFSQPGNGTLTYPIKVSQSGNYNLYIHSRRDGTGASDLHNDVWVRMNGGTWEKLYQEGGQHGVWTWRHKVERTSGHYQLAYNLNSGYHTLEFSGRSAQFQIDKIHLSTGGNMATSTPESTREP